MFHSDAKMTRSRVLLSTCAYVVVAVSVIGGAFFTTMALMPVESALAVSPQVSIGKIGPGYARMQPVNFGKPEKLTYSTPYYPHVAPRVSGINQRTPSIIVALVATSAAPMAIAGAARSTYNQPDVHRIY